MVEPDHLKLRPLFFFFKFPLICSCQYSEAEIIDVLSMVDSIISLPPNPKTLAEMESLKAFRGEKLLIFVFLEKI